MMFVVRIGNIVELRVFDVCQFICEQISEGLRITSISIGAAQAFPFGRILRRTTEAIGDPVSSGSPGCLGTTTTELAGYWY